MRISVVTILVCVGMSFTATAQEGDAESDNDAYSHLERGKSGFKETWVNPNTDWTSYDSLYLWEADFEYRDVGPARRTRGTMLNSRSREFGIFEEDRRKFEDEVSAAFVEEIQKAKNFEIVDQIGGNTLIMRGALLDIISRVPPEMVGRSEVYLSSIGEATLVLELIDARDGEVVALAAERRAMPAGSGRIDEFSMPTTSVSVWADVRRWARRAASKLRTELDKAIAGR